MQIIERHLYLNNETMHDNWVKPLRKLIGNHCMGNATGKEAIS